MTRQFRPLRDTFDLDAALYEEARPGYPEELFDDIVALSGIPDGGRILEVGCGTGIATVPLACRDYEMLCVEMGKNLADVARKNLAEYPNARVHVGAFEDWPVEDGAFDLAYAATAFHWIDPAIGFSKFAQALKAGGALALFRHEHVYSEKSAEFFQATQHFYEQAGLADQPEFRLPYPHEIEDDSAQIVSSGLFGPVAVRRYVWDVEYDTASYIRVLSTYSNHINLERAAQDRLFTQISNLIEAQPDGRITKGYMSILHVAKRL